jgi:hypothetical protein
MMNARFQELCLERRMGVMAACARSFAHGIFAVSFFERRPVAVMAGEAKRGLPSLQEVWLVRTMRKVADLTALPLHRPVTHFLLIIFLLMALIASLLPFRLQQMACLGGMGIMAGRASASLQGGMNVGLVQTYLLFGVAGITDLIPLFFQQKLWDQAMPEVAVLTFFLFDNRMNILHSQILFGEFLMAIQTILLHKPFPCRCSPSQGPSLCRLRTSNEQT